MAPHPLERLCNSFTDHGQKPGRIIVKSAGNERRQGRHATITVPQGTVKSLRWRSQNRLGLTAFAINRRDRDSSFIISTDIDSDCNRRLAPCLHRSTPHIET